MSSSHKSGAAIAILSTVMLLPFVLAEASEPDIKCPTTISAESLRVVDIPSGWVGFVSGPLALTAAGFMQAEPSKLADLKPSSTKRTAGGSIVSWVFAGPYPQGKWLSCEYAAGVASLSRRIPDATAECSVVYSKTSQGATVVNKITCK